MLFRPLAMLLLSSISVHAPHNDRQLAWICCYTQYRQYSYKTDRMVGVTDNSVLAIYPAYKYARDVEVCTTIV